MLAVIYYPAWAAMWEYLFYVISDYDKDVYCDDRVYEN